MITIIYQVTSWYSYNCQNNTLLKTFSHLGILHESKYHNFSKKKKKNVTSSKKNGWLYFVFFPCYENEPHISLALKKKTLKRSRELFAVPPAPAAGVTKDPHPPIVTLYLVCCAADGRQLEDLACSSVVALSWGFVSTQVWQLPSSFLYYSPGKVLVCKKINK